MSCFMLRVSGLRLRMARFLDHTFGQGQILQSSWQVGFCIHVHTIHTGQESRIENGYGYILGLKAEVQATWEVSFSHTTQISFVVRLNERNRIFKTWNGQLVH